MYFSSVTSPSLYPSSFHLSHLRRRECCGASIICSRCPPPTITNALFLSDLIFKFLPFSSMSPNELKNNGPHMAGVMWANSWRKSSTRGEWFG
ncbi:hypothetical protein VP01_7055g1, partial [Puccinia sorghi]